MKHGGVVLILGSGPNATLAAEWDKGWFDRIVAINNAWRVRADWDDLVFPEDFPVDRRPEKQAPGQRFIEADAFVPAQNAYGGFVYAGGTMAFTAAYWVLHALRPRVIGFLGCDMIYPKSGNTHFYGKGTADPLRDDVTLRDLRAKSARLALLAALQGCTCLNLSTDDSMLVFDRTTPQAIRTVAQGTNDAYARATDRLLQREEALGYFVASGRYWEETDRIDPEALAALDHAWLDLWNGNTTA